jgi:hypothetical protein
VLGAVRFDFLPLPALPRLAWGACLRAGDPVVRVLHGSWVETRPDAFIEGAWDAPFAACDFDRSPVLAGSGGRLTANGVRFAAPANMYERLQSVRVGDTLFVANSLAFLLALSGERLDPAHPHYYLDLLDHYRAGIRTKTKRLRLAGGRTLALHDCCNVDVSADLELRRVEKPWGDPPASYTEYAALLRDTLARMIANAADPARCRSYRPVAMVSTGYDSTAVAALARSLGCGEAVTFLRSRNHTVYSDDSGEQIARALGYAVTTYEREDSAAHPDHRPEEFYVEPWGVDRTMTGMAEQLAGALLLSGRSAEVVWSRGGKRHWGLPDFQHPINLMPGCALFELRLRTGFLHFAPATTAIMHAPRIHPWNETPELAPWSIGGDYDKPIARRIVEEAGVPRAWFGQEKKGGADRVDPVRNWLERRVDRLNRSPRIRWVIHRALGNRFHPRWKTGSFEIQQGVARTVERYAAAIGDALTSGSPAASEQR